jgi:hypothetical protein
MVKPPDPVEGALRCVPVSSRFVLPFRRQEPGSPVPVQLPPAVLVLRWPRWLPMRVTIAPAVDSAAQRKCAPWFISTRMRMAPGSPGLSRETVAGFAPKGPE